MTTPGEGFNSPEPGLAPAEQLHLAGEASQRLGEQVCTPAQIADLRNRPAGSDVVNVVTDWVLTTGVEQGRSDFRDPTGVDYDTEYPSFHGRIRRDESGWPINPVEPDITVGGHGDLVNLGPNLAGDCLAVCPDRQIGDYRGPAVALIVRFDNRDNGIIAQLALTGGQKDGTDESAFATGSREVREEIGLEVNPDPARAVAIYEGYVRDPRNTRHAWMETGAYAALVDASQDLQIDPHEVAAASWVRFDTPESFIADARRFLEEYAQQPRDDGRRVTYDPGDLFFASHGDIIERSFPIIHSQLLTA